MKDVERSEEWIKGFQAGCDEAQRVLEGNLSLLELAKENFNQVLYNIKAEKDASKNYHNL